MISNTKVFNLSLPRTATTSCGHIAKINQLRVCDGHWMDNKTNFITVCCLNSNYKTIVEFLKVYDFFSDLPWGGTDIYKYLSTKVENSNFILISRDEDEWWLSINRMINRHICERLFIPIEEVAKVSLEKRLQILFQFSLFGIVIWARYFCNNEFSKESFLNAKRKYEEDIILHFENDKRFHFSTFADFVSGKSNIFKDLKFKNVTIPRKNTSDGEIEFKFNPKLTEKNLEFIRSLQLKT